MSTELFAAIERHDLPRVTELLARGADPNAAQTDWPRFTALQAAINELEDGGPIDVINLLVKHGAVVDGWDADHQSTPLLMALLRDQGEAARILLDAGADPNVRGGEGDSPLRWSVEQDDLEMVRLLLGKGAVATIDECGEPRGLTALGIATEHLNIPIIALLLDAGADRDARDYDHLTARERLLPRESSDPIFRAEVLKLLAGPDSE